MIQLERKCTFFTDEFKCFVAKFRNLTVRTERDKTLFLEIFTPRLLQRLISLPDLYHSFLYHWPHYSFARMHIQSTQITASQSSRARKEHVVIQTSV